MGNALARQSTKTARLTVEPGGLLACGPEPGLDDFIALFDEHERAVLQRALATALTGLRVMLRTGLSLHDGRRATVTLRLWQHDEAHVHVDVADVDCKAPDVRAIRSALSSRAATHARVTRRSLELAQAGHVWEWNIDADLHDFAPALPGIVTPLANAPLEALLHPEDGDGASDVLLRLLRDHSPLQRSLRVQAPDGASHWYRVSGLLWCDEDGAPLFVEGLWVDVTDERGAADAMPERDAEIASLRQSLQDLSTRVIEAQETERRHIARELHDQTGQTLTTAVLDIEYWREKGIPPAEADSILATVKQALSEVRDISLQLRMPLLDQQGLEVALRSYLERQAQAARLDVEFSAEGQLRRLPASIERTGFRLVQEAVTNIIKHAGARHVEVLMRMGAREMTLRISDNGSGFITPDKLGNAQGALSLGLVNMDERAALVGGRCEFISSPAVGSIVLAKIPLPQDAG